MVRLDDVGHCPPIEAADAVAEAIVSLAERSLAIRARELQTV